MCVCVYLDALMNKHELARAVETQVLAPERQRRTYIEVPVGPAGEGEAQSTQVGESGRYKDHRAGGYAPRLNARGQNMDNAGEPCRQWAKGMCRFYTHDQPGSYMASDDIEAGRWHERQRADVERKKRRNAKYGAMKETRARAPRRRNVEPTAPSPPHVLGQHVVGRCVREREETSPFPSQRQYEHAVRTTQSSAGECSIL